MVYIHSVIIRKIRKIRKEAWIIAQKEQNSVQKQNRYNIAETNKIIETILQFASYITI